MPIIETITPTSDPPGKNRGRPKGSRNRPKFVPPPALPPAALRVDDAARYLSVSPTTIPARSATASWRPAD